MNQCAIARANEGNPSWSLEYLEVCYAAYVDSYAAYIMRMPTLAARRRAVTALPAKFRKQVEARILEKWNKR